jgi:hypothetical protein
LQESAVKHLAALLVLTGALALNNAANAKDLTLPKTSADTIKSACDKAGGKFSQDAKSYGCGTDCHGGPGTDCVVYCETGQKCTAQVIGGRRPHSVAAALTKPEGRQR